ncbi:hypothetical protein EDD21DRAFT_318592 [Dissophora ornata]|nr:hypothetical protein EDD21DRAFT_318592 [Dissophora ornata]
MNGYNILADVVNSRNRGRLNLTGKAVKELFGRHKKVYEEVKQKSEKTGFGLTDEDHENGINTIRAKLESVCMCFGRMDGFFGHTDRERADGNRANDNRTNRTRDGGDRDIQPKRQRLIVSEDEDEEVVLGRGNGNEKEGEEGAEGRTSRDRTAEYVNSEDVYGFEPILQDEDGSETGPPAKRSRASDKRKKPPASSLN